MKIVIKGKKWKKLVRRSRDAALDVSELARAGAEAVGRRAEDAVSRTRLERAVRDLREEIDTQMQAVGELIYATHRGSPSNSDDVQEILEFVDSLYEEMEGHQQELKRLRGELLCAGCGAENESANLYCHNCGQPLEAVDVIAVAAGPGSFTGLRIGVATAKGLAWPGDKDCAPCSTLESMAWPLAHMAGKVIVCVMDARRNQVYNALFRASGEGLERLAPDRAVSLEELAGELARYPEEKIVVGDGALLCYNSLNGRVPGLALAPVHLRLQSAWGVARAAEELAARGELVKGGDLTPVYHRLSQAERERLEREQSNTQ